MTVSRAQTRIHRSYPGAPREPVLTLDGDKQMTAYSIQLQNLHSAANDLAVLKGYSEHSKRLVKDDGAASVDVTDLINAGQNIAILEADGDAIYIGGKAQFGFFGLGLSTAGVGASTLALSYWNGSAWVALSNYEFIPAPLADYVYAIFPAPVDWAAGGQDLSAQSLPSQNTFYVKVTATSTWATTQPISNELVVAEIMTFKKEASQNATYELAIIDTSKPLELDSGEFIFAYFKESNALNSVEVSYSFQG